MKNILGQTSRAKIRKRLPIEPIRELGGVKGYTYTHRFPKIQSPHKREKKHPTPQQYTMATATNVKAIPALTPCPFYLNRSCRYSDNCMYQHGNYDQRVICLGCQLIRAPTGFKRCGPCHHTYKTARDQKEETARLQKDMEHERVRLERHQAYLEREARRTERKEVALACRKCERPRMAISATNDELFCPNCDEVRKCTTKTCQRMTSRPVCRTCHQDQSQKTVRRCRDCGGKIYPGQRDCVPCTINCDNDQETENYEENSVDYV